MKNEELVKNINKYAIKLPVSMIVIGIIASIFFIFYEKNLLEQIGIDTLKQQELTIQKEKLKTLVNYAINSIILLRKHNISEQKLIEEFKSVYRNKKNYVFIYKLNYPLKDAINHDKFAKLVININRPDLENKDISLTKKDVKSKEYRKEMLLKLIKHGEAYVTYYYKNPLTNKIEEKLSYFKYYQPLNFIVASGTYLNSFNEVVNSFSKKVEKLTINFIYVFISLSFFLLLLLIVIYRIILNLILKEIKIYQTNLRKETNKVKHQLYFDELTRLENRKLLIDKIKRNLFTNLILIDIDSFKNINQFFGAEMGDIYLKEFANLLRKFKKNEQKNISVFRIGSDEFVLGLRKSNTEETRKIAKKLNIFLEKSKIIINNDIFDVAATIVFSSAPNPLKKALIALSIAKDKHISLCSYDEIKDESKDKEYFEMKKLIKTAIEKNQVVPYAQPIFNKEEKIIKYELLMRIVTEDKVIPPYFLDYAKKARLYNELSKQMFQKCFEFIEKTDILCSVNIDITDIRNEEMVNLLEKYIDKIKKPVVFEILEYESITGYKSFEKFVEKFRKKGVLFAIDDFGSGFSNYKEVISLKPDYLKIDGSLIKDILENENNVILINSIVSLASTLKIKTTAEFVENREIFEKLKEIGVDEFQGYYFSKPLPLDEAEKLRKSQNL